jgi:hypothetical protein
MDKIDQFFSSSFHSVFDGMLSLIPPAFYFPPEEDLERVRFPTLEI